MSALVSDVTLDSLREDLRWREAFAVAMGCVAKLEARAQAVHGVEGDADLRQHCIDETERSTSPYAMAGFYNAQHVVNPRDMREFLKRLLTVYQMRGSGGVGLHLMQAWPTSQT